MNTQKFENNLFTLEVKTENGEPMFDIETVAKSLGFTKTEKKGNKTYTSIRWDRINSYLRPQVGENISKGDFISEPMVYKLAFKANNALAEKFQDWLATEVLPTIRKHGAYLTDQKIEEALLNPDVLINLATQLKEERTGRLIAEQRVNELQPKADYYDKILANPGLLPISVIAKNYGMSANKMNQVLHELGVQYKQGGTWLLYSNYQNEGYTHTEMKLWEGSTKMKPNTKWTQKGHLFIYNFLKKHDILPTIETLFDKAE